MNTLISLGSLRRIGIGLLLVAGLAACNDDNDAATTPVVVASNDTLTVALGASGQVLTNDTVDGQPATVGATGNVSFSVTTTPLPTGVTVTNGAIAVAASTVPGTYTIGYRICQASNTANCATANATVTVPAPPLVAAADAFTLNAGASGDVLANDTLGGSAVTSAQVTVTVVSALQGGITLSATGVVGVTTQAAPGLYPITYRICQTLVPTNCAQAVANVTVPSTATVSGRVVDAATAAGVQSVRVSVGALNTTTDASGAFSLAGVAPGERVNVLFTSNTYAETMRIANVAATGATDVQARMVRLGINAAVDVAAGGTVSIAGSTAQVVLPAGGVQRADGSVPSGNMQVRLTAIDPASDTAVMPGDFTTVVSGASTPIESFGALNVQLSDSAGAPLNLRAGQTSTIRIPMASRSGAPPASIPLFYFDNVTGRWVQEGTATLVGTGTGRYYQGTVTHFTTWNADQVMNTVRVTSCVADAAGARVAGARVSSDGIDYTGTSSTTTDAAGNFTIAIRANSSATLTSISGGLLSNTFRAGPYAVDTTVTTCLALGQTGAGITMKLTWGALPRDLDSYLLTPSGARINFNSRGSLTAAPFANLDVDDTSSFGPEVVTITRLMVGTYKYYIDNYSGFNAGSFTNASARVELSVPGRATELFTPPATVETSSIDTWTVVELDVDAQCNVTVRRTGAFASSAPTAATAPATYCMRP